MFVYIHDAPNHVTWQCAALWCHVDRCVNKCSKQVPCLPVNQMAQLCTRHTSLRHKFLAEFFKQDLTGRFTDLVILIDKEVKRCVQVGMPMAHYPLLLAVVLWQVFTTRVYLSDIINDPLHCLVTVNLLLIGTTSKIFSLFIISLWVAKLNLAITRKKIKKKLSLYHTRKRNYSSLNIGKYSLFSLKFSIRVF